MQRKERRKSNRMTPEEKFEVSQKTTGCETDCFTSIQPGKNVAAVCSDDFD